MGRCVCGLFTLLPNFQVHLDGWPGSMKSFGLSYGLFDGIFTVITINCNYKYKIFNLYMGCKVVEVEKPNAIIYKRCLFPSTNIYYINSHYNWAKQQQPLTISI